MGVSPRAEPEIGSVRAREVSLEQAAFAFGRTARAAGASERGGAEDFARAGDFSGRREVFHELGDAGSADTVVGNADDPEHAGENALADVVDVSYVNIARGFENVFAAAHVARAAGIGRKRTRFEHAYGP